MKIKLFEDFGNKPKIGDYIIANFDYTPDINWQNYINSNIGKIVKNDNKSIKEFVVRYEISEHYYNNDSEIKYATYEIRGKKYINMYFNEGQIRFWNSDKKNVELQLKISKYNI